MLSPHIFFESNNFLRYSQGKPHQNVSASFVLIWFIKKTQTVLSFFQWSPVHPSFYNPIQLSVLCSSISYHCLDWCACSFGPDLSFNCRSMFRFYSGISTSRHSPKFIVIYIFFIIPGYFLLIQPQESLRPGWSLFSSLWSPSQRSLY